MLPLTQTLPFDGHVFHLNFISFTIILMLPQKVLRSNGYDIKNRIQQGKKAIRLLNSLPVSYTHLDVYKRQSSFIPQYLYLHYFLGHSGVIHTFILYVLPTLTLYPVVV